MKEAGQLGLVGMVTGTVLGYMLMVRSCGAVEIDSKDFVPMLLGILFIVLVIAIFAFLIGLAFSRRDK